MGFQNVVCWSAARAERVMDTEALQPPDDVFLATHHPVPMFRTTLTSLYSGTRADLTSRTLYSENDLLRDFLAPKDFAFIPVLGEAGTGKSHLIRWLAAHIPSTATRHVLLIPKVDTNLRDVLARILALPGTEGATFDDYRARLRRATSELRSEREAREKLLNNLAVACGRNGPHQMRGLSEAQEYLVESLPSLLYDPFFREHLLRDDGIVHRLVAHAIGDTGRVERLQERREFKGDDLPLRVEHSKRASEAAREFYNVLLGDDGLQQETVKWLNLNLSAAISELLELKGEALFRLMLEVRESLGRKGFELVLLIEDFAKLQGIDMQLLEAVIAKPQQEGRGRLCPLRTALACTTGYFRTLVQTVQTRVDFCVTLDLAPTDSAAMGPGEIERFVARYLNVARLGEEALARWFAEARAVADGEAVPVPSACEACPHRAGCHDAFGASEGVGLYPFTAVAIPRMMARSSPEGFNPRLLLKDVLKHVLAAYADDLRAGTFPPQALAEHFKGVKLPGVVRDDLARSDAATRSRRAVLLDLWTDGTRLADLAPGIHEAFSLPLLGRSVPAADPVERRPAELVPTPNEAPTGNLAEYLALLDAWPGGGAIPQPLVHELREALFPAIREHINWDAELLVRGHFAEATGNKPFRQTSISFARQAVRAGARPAIMLAIPTDPTDTTALTDTSLALQGLLLFRRNGNWKFRHAGRPGSYYFRKYARLLDQWSAEVLRQARSSRASGEAWDPVPAAVEILALAARMVGRPPSSRTGLADQISALFEKIDGVETDHRGPAWQELMKALRDNHQSLVDIVLSRVPCTKGGSRAVQVIDASQLAGPLRQIRRTWVPAAEMPADAWGEFAPLRKAREKVDALLARAVEEEKARFVAWHEAAVGAIGQGASRNDLVEVVRTAVEAATQEGVFPAGMRERLDPAIDAFSRCRFDNALQAAQRIRDEADAGVLVGELGRADLHTPMAATTGFIEAVRQFLEASTRRVEQDIAESEGAGELRAVQQEIEQSLERLGQHLGLLCGEGPCSSTIANA